MLRRHTDVKTARIKQALRTRKRGLRPPSLPFLRLEGYDRHSVYPVGAHPVMALASRQAISNAGVTNSGFL